MRAKVRASSHSRDPAAPGSSGVNGAISCYLSLCEQTWGKLIVNANALIMHSFFPVIQGND